MKYELRDCPFCGGNPIFKTMILFSKSSECGLEFNVGCAKCGASAPVQHIPEIKFNLMEDGEVLVVKDERYYAAATWNGTIHEVGMSYMESVDEVKEADDETN